ncbi:hypothetical protein PENTCL1PPCAC_22970, partial [Pristionchus entomophagus]
EQEEGREWGTRDSSIRTTPSTEYPSTTTTSPFIPSSTTTTSPSIAFRKTTPSWGFEWWNAQSETRPSTATPFQWWTVPQSHTTPRMRHRPPSTRSTHDSPITERTRRTVQTTTVHEDYATEEYDEETTKETAYTQEPTTTPELILFKTTQFKDVNKRAHFDLDGFTKPVTTTTEMTTTMEKEETTTEEEEEERQPEEMIIESLWVTTEVSLPSSPSLPLPDRSPLPHPPMLFHSSLEDEFPRPGWVKGDKKHTTEVPIQEEE